MRILEEVYIHRVWPVPGTAATTPDYARLYAAKLAGAVDPYVLPSCEQAGCRHGLSSVVASLEQQLSVSSSSPPRKYGPRHFRRGNAGPGP